MMMNEKHKQNCLIYNTVIQRNAFNCVFLIKILFVSSLKAFSNVILSLFLADLSTIRCRENKYMYNESMAKRICLSLFYE